MVHPDHIRQDLALEAMEKTCYSDSHASPVGKCQNVLCILEPAQQLAEGSGRIRERVFPRLQDIMITTSFDCHKVPNPKLLYCDRY